MLSTVSKISMNLNSRDDTLINEFIDKKGIKEIMIFIDKCLEIDEIDLINCAC